MDSSAEMSQNSFNILFLKRILKMASFLFPSICSANTILLIFLLSLCLLEQVTVYQVGMVASKYYKTLGEKDFDGFMSLTVIALLLMIGIAFILGTKSYVANCLYLLWRKLITEKLHQTYFNFNTFYNIVTFSQIDNPDQRIAQDIERCSKTFSAIFPDLVIAPFTIAYYIYKSTLIIGWYGPVTCLIFFIFATVINKFLMSSVAKSIFKQEKHEGDFRYKHMKIRANAESVAFMNSGDFEFANTQKKLVALINVQKILIFKQYFLTFFVKFCDYIASILSYVTLAVPLFAGAYDSMSKVDLAAHISASSFITMYLVNQFTKLIDMSVQMTEVVGTTHRIVKMYEEMIEYGNDLTTRRNSEMNLVTSIGEKYILRANEESDEMHSNITLAKNEVPNARESVVGRPDNFLVVSNLSVHVPSVAKQASRLLIHNLSFTIMENRSLLISGPSGCGKSALLRILANLWPSQTSDGQIERPTIQWITKDVLFVPQKAYLTDGSFHELMAYPDSSLSSVLAVSEAAHYSRRLRLEHLHLEELSPDTDWMSVLSPGEQQRVALLRVCLRKPRLAILDEATSQLDEETECEAYSLLAELGITVVSVAHRSTVRRFHQDELSIRTDNSWHVSTI